MKYRKLNSAPEINLSSLARKAGISPAKLLQAVRGHRYSAKYPETVRKLNDEEQIKLKAALYKLVDKLAKIADT